MDQSSIQILEDAILAVARDGQSVRMPDGLEVTRANLGEMRRLLAEWKQELRADAATGVRRVVFRRGL